MCIRDRSTPIPENDQEDVLPPIVNELEVGFEQTLSDEALDCLLYTSPSPRDRTRYRMPSSA